MGIKFYRIVSPTILSFVNGTGPITLPLSSEITVASITQSVEAGQLLKIDYALNVIASTTANWSISFELRLYRDDALINTRSYSRNGSQVGDQYIPMSSTYVDTAPVTLTTSTYDLKAIITAASNATAKTGVSIDLNIITFTNN